MAINLPLQNQSFYVMNVIGKPAATSHTMWISIIITLMFLPYNLNIISDPHFSQIIYTIHCTGNYCFIFPQALCLVYSLARRIVHMILKFKASLQ